MVDKGKLYEVKFNVRNMVKLKLLTKMVGCKEGTFIYYMAEPKLLIIQILNFLAYGALTIFSISLGVSGFAAIMGMVWGFNVGVMLMYIRALAQFEGGL